MIVRCLRIGKIVFLYYRHLKFKQMFVNKRDVILDDSIPVFHSVGRNPTTLTKGSMATGWNNGMV